MSTTDTDTNVHAIRILRVLGTRSKSPVVLVEVDGYFVRWTPKDGWSCVCDEDTYPECPHIPTVEGMLDARVIGDAA